MPNKIYPQLKSDLYKQIEEQVGRVNFLTKMMQVSFVSPDLEEEFIDRGFGKVIQHIKQRCAGISGELLAEQLRVEEENLKTLSKQSIKD